MWVRMSKTNRNYYSASENRYYDLSDLSYSDYYKLRRKEVLYYRRTPLVIRLAIRLAVQDAKTSMRNLLCSDEGFWKFGKGE